MRFGAGRGQNERLVNAPQIVGRGRTMGLSLSPGRRSGSPKGWPWSSGATCTRITRSASSRGLSFAFLVKALARAFRWKRMLESGEFATIAELAEREGIATSYMTRILRLTQLEPGIIEAVLDGRQNDAVTLARLMDPFPMSWIEQKNIFFGT